MKVLVTGGTGTVGHVLVQRLLEDPEVEIVRTISLSEYRTIVFRQAFGSDSRIDVVTGDVSDYRTLEFNAHGFDVIFHLAAMKHVDLVEKDPYLAVSTNIIGTKNVVDVALRQGIQRVVVMSTDKVVHATSLYGATKLIAERVALNGNRIKPLFNVLRSGNILNSNGSVLDVWMRQVEQSNAINVTDPQMTRYFISQGDIGRFLVGMVRQDVGTVVVPKAPSVRLSDLARAFIELFGDAHTRLNYEGKRVGEKVHEELVSVEELERTEELEDRYVVHPRRIPRAIKAVPASSDSVLSPPAVRELLANTMPQAKARPVRGIVGGG